ncbi:MAG: hypothetical protein KGN16_08960 [Burkholderiales bacterium]|nr:hypothetical protein [Burkholderiales bacterium]
MPHPTVSNLNEYFGNPRSVHSEFLKVVHYNDRFWRDAPESNWEFRPANDHWWLYKLKDCTGWMDGYRENLAGWPNGASKGLYSSKDLIYGLATHIGEMYRGLWILECNIAGHHLPDVTGETQMLAFDLLERLEQVRVKFRQHPAAKAWLRKELQQLLGELQGHYRRTIEKLPIGMRNPHSEQAFAQLLR